ncbi:sodium-dependent transporter [Salinisphaera hydrothermalis]|uniref:sodium-dependent transporter n=1 Tax=Salinisphaera hydrothermalis TaxID=563188 RepID=UPI00333F8DF6
MSAPTRGGWASRFGFIMAAAGSAIGLGNIWKFPYMTASHGGGAFLVVYLVCVFVFGISLLLAELVLGRMAKRNPIGAFRKLAGGAWPAVGALGVVTALVILSFYVVVSGWAMAYFVYAVEGTLTTASSGELKALFGHLVSSPIVPLIYAALFVLLTAVVVIGGVAGGIERMAKLFMPLLFIILILLMVRSLTLPGAGRGLIFFLHPDWSAIDGHLISAALGQAFFTLSLGVGGMITYGSYMADTQDLGRDALSVVALNTMVSLLAGLMVIPAMISAGITPDAGGPGTTFKVLPTVFAAMPAGNLFGIGFFFLLILAALTSSVSLLEPVVSFFVDEYGMKRANATVIGAGFCFALAIPVSLSFGIWHHIQLFGLTIFKLMDFLTSNLALPIGSLMTALCVGWVVRRAAVDELSNHGRIAAGWAPIWLFFIRYIAPIGIVWILVQGLFGL